MQTIFMPELLGTFLLIVLGCGVVANVALAGTKGNGGGFLMVNFGWGIAVFVGVYAAAKSGGHLNPAVTLGQLVAGNTKAADVPLYLAAQMIGAILGAVVVYLAYKNHFDDEPEAANKLGVFATGPAKRSYLWNVITEIIATYVLVFWIISSTMKENTGNAALGALAVAFVIVGIGASLGGPTGYAINPARDLGPRIAHAILPIKGKGDSDWAYSWVPVVGPLIGGLLAGLTAPMLLGM